MHPFPTSHDPEAATSPPPAAVAEARRFLAILAGSRQDEALLRYAAYWADLHPQHAAAEPASAERAAAALREPLLGTAVLAGTTLQGRDLFVTAPQGVQALRAPTAEGTALDDLLKRAAASGSDAVAVGDGGGRQLACDLVRRASCSVWFVPDGARPAARRLLVPIDFSLPAADSLRVAAILARLSGAAECVALHVYFNDSYLTGSWGEQAARHAAWTAFDHFMKPIDTLGVKVTPCFREAADVSRAINETAAEWETNLIVLASRGRSWSASLLQPTVAEQTLRTCQVPLLVVKHFGAQRGFLSLLMERLCSPTTGLRCN